MSKHFLQQLYASLTKNVSVKVVTVHMLMMMDILSKIWGITDWAKKTQHV